MKTWISTYCNFPHRMSNGAPIAHECDVLPPAALEAEREDRIDDAIAIIRANRPLRHMVRGVREPTTP